MILPEPVKIEEFFETGEVSDTVEENKEIFEEDTSLIEENKECYEENTSDIEENEESYEEETKMDNIMDISITYPEAYSHRRTTSEKLLERQEKEKKKNTYNPVYRARDTSHPS